MRVRLVDGKVVKLLHWNFSGSHVRLLRELQHEVPNMEIKTENGWVQLHELLLTWKLLNQLNLPNG